MITVNGKKAPLTLCRMIFQLEDDDAAWPVDARELLVSGGTSTERRKNGKKASAAARKGEASPQVVQPEDVTIPGATKVFVEQIAAVRSSAFDVKAIQEPIKQPGRYGVAFTPLSRHRGSGSTYGCW